MWKLIEIIFVITIADSPIVKKPIGGVRDVLYEVAR